MTRLFEVHNPVSFADITAEEAYDLGRRDEKEECAKIADAHKGSAAKQRQEKGHLLRDMEDGLHVEVNAEERGEDIAAETIAAAIRARGEE